MASCLKSLYFSSPNFTGVPQNIYGDYVCKDLINFSFNVAYKREEYFLHLEKSDKDSFTLAQLLQDKIKLKEKYNKTEFTCYVSLISLSPMLSPVQLVGVHGALNTSTSTTLYFAACIFQRTSYNIIIIIITLTIVTWTNY